MITKSKVSKESPHQMTPAQKERKRELKITLGTLYKTKPQRKPAYWQCVRLTVKPEYQATSKKDFVPATMAASAVCLECGEGIVYRPGGNAVVDHMKVKHSALVNNYRSTSPQKSTKKRRSLEGGVVIKPRRNLPDSDKKAVKRMLAKWIARRMRPLRIVEDPELQELCDLFGDFGGFNFDMPKRGVIREEIVQMASVLRETLKGELASKADHYCLTTDIWTDRNARSFMSLTPSSPSTTSSWGSPIFQESMTPSVSVRKSPSFSRNGSLTKTSAPCWYETAPPTQSRELSSPVCRACPVLLIPCNWCWLVHSCAHANRRVRKEKR